VHECSACRGAFVDYTTLAGLVKREIDRRHDTPFAPALAQRPADVPRPDDGDLHVRLLVQEG